MPAKKTDEFKLHLIDYFSRSKESYREFGEKIGVSPGQVSNYVNGVSFPTFQIICKMIESGVTLAEIFGNDLIASSNSNRNENEQFVKHNFNNISFDPQNWSFGGASSIDMFFDVFPNKERVFLLNRQINCIEFKMYHDKNFEQKESPKK